MSIPTSLPRPRLPGSPAGQPPPRIRIEQPRPLVDCGRHPVKRTVGDPVDVRALIFRDGHEVLRAAVRFRPVGERRWREAPMRRVDAHLDGDTWAGSFTVDECGRWEWTICAWSDRFASWRHEVSRKLEAGQRDLGGELSEGALLLEGACARMRGEHRATVERALQVVASDAPQPQRVTAALDEEVYRLVELHPDRHDAATMSTPLRVDVERERARFGAWYELFPRSWGGFRGVTEQLPRLAELGFDVVYLPPVHPIGRTNRKGPNNSLVAGPGDPGSPWAIGGPEGGHTGLHPDLGTMDDFEALVAAASELGMEIALDFAIQCSADHPWLAEHPEWFHRRPDGTLKYAENPPKRYQDIYNVNFDSPDWSGLWEALLEVVQFWVDHGVRIFRVDNPHTKPLPFWEWLIGEVRARHPDVIFLSEAFTRRAMMRALAKIGFSQSYTYFTWKNSRHELSEYVHELAHSGEQEYFRPNFFVNTPDILHAYLQHGGPPAFAARLVLAATMSPSYGVYSGYESFENVPVREGSEEYLDSEKYEVRPRRLDGPLLGTIGRINRIRRENPALQHLDNITFLDSHNDALIAYGKRTGDNAVVVVVNIDPGIAQDGLVVVPASLGTPPAFTASDLLSGAHWTWHIGGNFVRLGPGQSHVLRVQT